MLEIFLHTLAQFDVESFSQVVEKPDSEWGWYVFLFFTSFVKFALAAITALAEPDINILEFFLTVGGGALVSVVFYTYFGEQFRRWFVKNVVRREAQEEIQNGQKKNNKITKIWDRYGLPGVAMLAPFLSPMVCVGVAVSFREDPRRIIFFNGMSIILWTIIFALLREQVLDFARETGLIKA